jgi:fructuronate reductase
VTPPAQPPVLDRRSCRGATAPVRIVHLGLGAFHRAHQAFYTDRVDDQRQWGIAAFTGRSPQLARTLAGQDGLYTLIERSDSGDAMSTVASIVEARDGSELGRLAQLVAAPATALITLTVTEAGYRVRGGALDLDADVRSDLDTLTDAKERGQVPAELRTVPARLAFALDARRRSGAGALAVVPCDNLADNGAAIEAALLGVTGAVDPTLRSWIEAQVSFVSTCVDRITPATTPADLAAVTRERGYVDRAPVVTEPFRDWVLSGAFPAGRPAWENAGARFVDDIGPYENRKLWLLNGAHSLLAYLGTPRGLTTVAEAIADPGCRRAVDAFWDLAETQLREDALDLTNYRAQLLQRFANRRISHQLAQIAKDGSVKLRNRVVPLVKDAGRGVDVRPALSVLAAWIDYLAAQPEVTLQLDPAAAAIGAARELAPAAETRALLTLLEPTWRGEDALLAAVHALRQPPSRSPS